MPGVKGALNHLISFIIAAAFDEVIRNPFVADEMRRVKGTNHDCLGVGPRVNVDVVDFSHGLKKTP